MDVDPFKQDPQLLDRFRAGQSMALEQVYRAFEKPLRNFVVRGFAFKSGARDLFFRGLWSDHDLDDIVQETFRRAFGVRARQAYDGVRPYKNYLFTIARNAVINDLAARGRQIPVGEAISCDSASDEMGPLESWVASQRAAFAGEALTSHDRVENLEVFGLVESYVESLGVDEQQFFRLRFLTELSQEKTARELGWNRAKVRKLEAKLRRSFLCHVGGSGYLEQHDDPIRKTTCARPKTFERARQIWRAGRAEHPYEILHDAA